MIIETAMFSFKDWRSEKENTLHPEKQKAPTDKEIANKVIPL